MQNAAPQGQTRIAHQFQTDAQEICNLVMDKVDLNDEGSEESVALLARCLLRFSVHQLGEGGEVNMDGTANLFGGYALPEIRRRYQDLKQQQILATFLAGNVSITIGYHRVMWGS